MTAHRLARVRCAALAGALACLLAGCGISADDAPRDINAPAGQANASDEGLTAITATRTSTIYLVGHDDSGRFVLKPVARDVTETIDNALAALFAGATPREINADLRSAIPPSTRLVSATPNNDIVTVDVTASLAELSGSTLVDAVGQIVLTATDVTGVNGVVITIGDVVHPWPTPEGDLTTDPLTRDDFAALLADDGVEATDPTLDPTVPSSVPAPTEPATTAPPSTATPTASPAPTAPAPTAPAEEPPPEVDDATISPDETSP